MSKQLYMPAFCWNHGGWANTELGLKRQKTIHKKKYGTECKWKT